MAYQNPFVKMNFEGHFGTSTGKAELWQAGLHLAAPGPIAASPVELLAFLTAIQATVSAFHSQAANVVGTSCYLDSLSAALIGVDGKYALGSLQPTTRYTYGSAVAGAGTANGPWSQAMVWTLRSAILRGPASHGRTYYPALAATVTPATGVVAGATVTALSTNVRNLLNAINVAASANLAVSTNVSNVSPIGLGYRAPVTSIGIGQRLDAMESRERNIPEAHVFSPLTIALAVNSDVNREYRERLDEYYEQLEDGNP